VTDFVFVFLIIVLFLLPYTCKALLACVESAILRGWLTSRLNFRIKGYISCWSLWTVR